MTDFLRDSIYENEPNPKKRMDKLEAKLNEMAVKASTESKSIVDFPLTLPERSDSARINRAFKYGQDRGYRVPIFFPNDTVYKIDSKITLDVNFSAMIGYGFIFDASSIISGEALLVIGTKYPTYRNTITAITGLQLMGQSQAIPGSPSPAEITAAKAKDTIGIKFDGVGMAGASHINIQNTNVYGFGLGVQYNNHAYIITFENSDVYWCGTCVEMPAGKTDYGERITFAQCSFYNSDTLIKQGNPDGSMKFVTCSFDYQAYKSFHVTGGRVTVIGGHVEASNDNDYHWYVTGQGSLLQFNSVEFVVPKAKGEDSNGNSIDGKFEIGYCDASVALGGIQLTDCFMSIPRYTKQFLIAGEGRVKGNITTNQLDKKFSMAKSLNRLRDGSFKDVNALLDWTVEKGTPAIDNVTFQTGTGSLYLNSPDGSGITMNTEIPCHPGALVNTTMYIKTQELATNSKILYVQRRYLDSKGNALYDATEQVKTDFDWKLYVFQDYKLAPPGTAKFQLRLNTGATTSACKMWVDEACITVTS